MTSSEAAAAARPYDGLAPIYDYVMRHVDYVHWAHYVESLLRRFDCAPQSLVELACGTGNATLALSDLGYRMAGYDASEAMVRVARQKAEGRDLPFGVRDLCDLSGLGLYDAAVCLYDSFNYLLTTEHLGLALAQVHGVLSPGACFIFDVCTEQNSVRHFRDVQEVEQGPGFVYSRYSHYDAGERLQFNEFDIQSSGGPRVQEVHVQRIYRLSELTAAVAASPFQLLGAFDGFSQRPGSERSDRIHFALRRPG